MRLINLLIPRLAIAALTMLGVSSLVFVSLRLIPGGFADVLLGPFATPEARAMIEVKFGLDESIPVQFFKWLIALLQGDFGTSMVTRTPVIDEFLRRGPVTAELALLTFTFAIGIGFPLGVWSGIAEGSGSPRASLGRIVGALGASVPEFVLGSALIFIFSRWSLGLKVGGFVPFGEDLWGNLRTMILPTASLGVFGIALILRTTRDAVLRTTLIPIITVAATYFGFLMGGAVIAEVLFSIPGVGYYIFSSLEGRDYAVVQAGVLLAAFIFVALNMLADLAYAGIDPRIGAKRIRT